MLSIIRPALIGALCVASSTMALAADGDLRVIVDNVRNANGAVHIAVCPENLWLKEGCVNRAVTPARKGVTEIIVKGLPAGRYGAQLYHDENGNNQLDRGTFGIPKEGVGFSNDAPIRMGPPKFKDAGFDYNGRDGTIRLKMRYFSGDKGPSGS